MATQAGELKFSQTLDFSNKHRSVIEGTSKAKMTFTDQDRQDFGANGGAFLDGIDAFHAGEMTPETYIEQVFVGLWSAIGRHRKSIPSQAQILSSVPSTALAGLLCDIPAMMRDHLGEIHVGTEVSCISGTAEDGSPLCKNQDVAIYFTSNGRNVPLIAWEVKENYIDKTMLEGTKSTGLSTMAVFKHARTEVMTPAITGGKPGRHVKMRILCPSQTGRNADNRVFDAATILAIRNDAIAYLKSLDRETLTGWSFPDYSTFIVEKTLLELEGQPEAISKLKEALLYSG